MLSDKLWTRTSPGMPSTPDNTKSSYEELILGVWRVLIMEDSRFSMFNPQWKNLSSSSTFPLLHRALYEVYTISPRFFALHVMSHLWSSIEGPLSLYFTNKLLFFIEKRLSGGTAIGRTSSDLYFAVVSRIICSVFSAYMRWSSQRGGRAYSSRIKYEIQARIVSANLASDLSTSQDSATSRVDAESVYDCLQRGTMLLMDVISFLLHLRLITSVIGNGLDDGGPVFLALCMLPSLMRYFRPRDLWTKAYVVTAGNNFYIRKSALAKLAQPGLKQEVIAGGIDKFLIEEYRKAKDDLGDIPDDQPEMLYARERNALLNITASLCSDLPTLYFAFLALLSPSKLSVVQLAVLNQTSTSLRFTFASLGLSFELWPAAVSRMKNLYAVLDAKNKMKDGETSFPRPGYEASAGMSIEVKDVSFSYPSSKTERAALSDVSFTIQPGQLVVVVGANGSGKSTIIKLLGRFYDPTSGSIRVDGIPIIEYRMDELRKGIAMLTQEHQLFPLSVKENINLGSSEAEAMDNEEKIGQSASAAGADSVVKNFSSGYDTVLEPVNNGYLSYAGEGNKELEALHKKLEKPTSISGGEKQKLVAARTFMRLFTSPVKLVTVDEPSSALDPEAEYQLFANLREERKGRTMIFITHRFGHLTKHADLIICMKEGAVVETGSHADLLARGGEYARLYNVQAQAFATT